MEPCVIGIDLGTTNTVLAEARPGGAVEVVPISQVVGAREREARFQLPSCLYAASLGEDLPDPWDEAPWSVGVFAQQRGLEVPGRLVSSAKSWLSHAGIDRTSPCLPWGVEDESLPRLSPLEASSKLLAHLQKTYDAERPGAPLHRQSVVLTVPASFDQSARQLTLEAAARAGLHVRLLEEPVAAFYDYLGQGGEAVLTERVGKHGSCSVLVCDVGGGTTDFSLLRATPSEDGALCLERTAVGRHILLGGDNIDLALAHVAEARLTGDQGIHLEPRLFSQLVLACRAAKEHLLGGGGEVARVTIVKSGSQLIGNTLSTSLTRSEVEGLVSAGFFPRVPLEASAVPRRAGFRAFGLPYEPDPAITRHLAAFLTRHAKQALPELILLNGGVFRSALLQRLLAEAYAEWLGKEPEFLVGTDADLAVARGAVVFGRALRGEGLRIGGGAAHGYYVGIAAPGDVARALCVVPRGAREGEKHQVEGHPLALRLGQPVRFELYASDSSLVHAPGQIVDVDDDLELLPPLAASFDAEEAGEVEVVLEGELSAVGTLDLACVERNATGDQPRHFRLAFELRGQETRLGTTRREQRQSRSTGAPPSKLNEAAEYVHRVFGKGRSDVRPREVKDLWQSLERLLGERRSWDVETCRVLFDIVAPKHRARRRTLDHERVFCMLAGFCLRPGFGHPLDTRRIGLIAPLFEEGLAFQDEVRGWQQFWILWRRLAPGLPEAQQVAIRDRLDPFLAPTEEKLKKPKGFRPGAAPEMLELASYLERIPVVRRAELGRWLLERTWTNRDPALWRALGRIGARVPAYASAHHVVPAHTAQRWVEHLLREDWAIDPALPRAAVDMAALTGDRTRDLPESQRAQVLARLTTQGVPDSWLERVREVVPVERYQADERFGEELPAGLTLLTRIDE